MKVRADSLHRGAWRRTGWLVLWLTALLLGGCAMTPPRPTSAPAQLFNDSLFAAPGERIDAAAALALSAEMGSYLAREIVPLARKVGPQQALIEALYSRGMLRLDYDAARTRSASEAFADRAGNCLSLVMMTAAFARAMDLPVRFQSVLSDEAWDRSGDLYFFIGHVNLQVGTRVALTRVGLAGTEWMTIDFVPGVDLKRQRAHQIDEARVLAMFSNNRAAEALVDGRLDDAYAWARAAIVQDPGFLNTYNTLGVVYNRRGAAHEAERALRFALGHEPASVHVLGNLAVVLRQQGRDAEAEPLLAELRRLQPHPPFALFNQGVQAAQRGDWRSARRLFEDELARSPDYHEFHFWLARALLALGDVKGAGRHLKQAAENSSTLEQGAIYSAKLDKLRPLLAQ